MVKNARRLLGILVVVTILAGVQVSSSGEMQLSQALEEIELVLEYDGITADLLEMERDLAKGIADGSVQYQPQELNWFYERYFDALLVKGQPGETNGELSGYIHAVRAWCDGLDWSSVKGEVFNQIMIVPDVFDRMMLYVDQSDPQILQFYQWFQDSLIARLKGMSLLEEYKAYLQVSDMGFACAIAQLKDSGAPLSGIISQYDSSDILVQMYLETIKQIIAISEYCRVGNGQSASDAFRLALDTIREPYAQGISLANDDTRQEAIDSAEQDIAEMLGSIQDMLFLNWKRGVLSTDGVKSLISQVDLSLALRVDQVSVADAAPDCPFLQGDCLTAVDGVPIGTYRQFYALLFQPSPGSRTVTLQRDGVSQDVRISGPQDLGGVSLASVFLGAGPDSLGFESDRLVIRK